MTRSQWDVCWCLAHGDRLTPPPDRRRSLYELKRQEGSLVRWVRASTVDAMIKNGLITGDLTPTDLGRYLATMDSRKAQKEFRKRGATK